MKTDTLRSSPLSELTIIYIKASDGGQRLIKWSAFCVAHSIFTTVPCLSRLKLLFCHYNNRLPSGTISVIFIEIKRTQAKLLHFLNDKVDNS